MTVIAFDSKNNDVILYKGKYNTMEEAAEIFKMYGDGCLIETYSNNGFENILR